MNIDGGVAPVAVKHRITALDVLRGFALLGILLLNIEDFSGPEVLHDIPLSLTQSTVHDSDFRLGASALWLRYFSYGPLEWLWRSLVYWRRQPLCVDTREPHIRTSVRP